MRSQLWLRIFMFLKQVYKHSKWLFVAMILFVIGQLFINYKHGMVFSPLYHYGMYSEVMSDQKSFEVFEVYADGKMLAGKDFSPQKWDKILLPLQFYTGINHSSNPMYTENIERLLAKVHVQSTPGKFLQNCNQSAFYQWYKSYVSGIINKPIDTIVINRRIYRLQNKTLQPTDSLVSISALCE